VDIEIIDITKDDDDPYRDWNISPDKKFVEELLKNGYEHSDIYEIDLDGERGIMVDYNLFPHEHLKYDSKENLMKLKMKYVPFLRFKEALIDLGILYDTEYWGE